MVTDEAVWKLHFGWKKAKVRRDVVLGLVVIAFQRTVDLQDISRSFHQTHHNQVRYAYNMAR